MAKIKLGSAPKTIDHVVKIKLLDGSTSNVKVTYVLRNREQFGIYLDEYNALSKAAETDEDVPAVERQRNLIDLNAKFILGAVTQWDLDDEFDLENVKALCSEFPQVCQKIITDYYGACIDGRLGN